jgi:hypothetical protein
MAAPAPEPVFPGPEGEEDVEDIQAEPWVESGPTSP